MTELVGALAGGRPGTGLLKLAAGAAGNPLYLTELLAALARSDGITVYPAGNAQLAAGSVPDSLPGVIADRLGFVSASTREVLRAAALLGLEFAIADLTTVLGRTVTDLVPALDEARSTGVLTDSGNGLAFRHPLIRDALYAEMPASVRAAWHRDAGHALAAAGAAARARRPAAAARPGRRRRGVDAGLARHVGRLPGRPGTRGGGGAARPDGRRHPGRVRQARLAGRPARGRALPHRRPGGGRAGGRAGTRPRGRPRPGRGPALDAGAVPDAGRARPRSPSRRSNGRSPRPSSRPPTAPGCSCSAPAPTCTSATSTRPAGRPLPRWPRRRDGRHLGDGLGAERARGRGHRAGQLANALPLYDQGLAVAGTDPALTDLGLLLLINKSVTLCNLNRYDEALATAERARQLADQVGTAIRLAQAHGVLGQLFFETGRWDDALTEIEAVPTDLKEPGAACGEFGTLAVISFHRNEPACAREHLAATEPHVDRFGHRSIPPLILAWSLIREQAGDLPDALTVLTAAFEANPDDLGETEDLLRDAVRLAVKTGDKRTAQTLAGGVASLADGRGFRTGRPTRSTAEG